MDWTRHDAVITRWREQTLAYVAAVNAWVEKGDTVGWDHVGPEPEDPRTSELGEQIAQVVREANEAGAWREIRDRIPPAHTPFIEILEQRAVTIRSVHFVDEDTVVAAVGSPWQPETVMTFGYDGDAEPHASAATDVGASPDRRYFALLGQDGVEVLDGWDGPIVARCPLPTGNEGVPDGEPHDEAPVNVEALAVLPDGRGVVLATSKGVYLSQSDHVARLCPSEAELAAQFEDWDEAKYGPYRLRTDMTHVAVHPDGDLIACGWQDSPHVIVSRDGQRYATFGPVHSEYPHHAAFCPDGTLGIFNSCHFYNGATVVATMRELSNVHVEPYAEDERLRVLDQRCRVYDSTFVDGCFALGDAGGYLRAVSPRGEAMWNHFLGSSVGGVDTSPSGDRVAMSTAAGFLALLERSDAPDPAQIGDSPFVERVRFVRWAGQPLIRW